MEAQTLYLEAKESTTAEFLEKDQKVPGPFFEKGSNSTVTRSLEASRRFIVLS